MKFEYIACFVTFSGNLLHQWRGTKPPAGAAGGSTAIRVAQQAPCRGRRRLVRSPSNVNSFHTSGRDLTPGKPPAGVDRDSGRA